MARALDLHSRGQGFDSLILHKREKENKGEERENEKRERRERINKRNTKRRLVK